MGTHGKMARIVISSEYIDMTNKSKKISLGTDHPFYQFMKLSGSSLLQLAGFSPKQAANYYFDSVVLKEKRVEPDIQALPMLKNNSGRIVIEFQGYADKFIHYRVLLEILQICVLSKHEQSVKAIIIYTDSAYQQCVLPLSNIASELQLDIQEIVLTDYNLQQLLDIDPKLIVFAPFTQSKTIKKQVLLKNIQEWTQTLKQIYSIDRQQNALNVLSLFVLDRFRQLSYEEVMNMMHFNLLDTRAGQDILRMGENQGIAAGLIKGKQEGLIEGKQEGQLEKTLDIAKALLLEGSPISFIAKITSLSESEIMTLKIEIDKMKH
jgi:predicted transposase/invertase (TIGR01784 family)